MVHSFYDLINLYPLNSLNPLHCLTRE